MLRFLADIPDYDEELRRLKELEDKSFLDYLNDLLGKLFDVNINEDLSWILQYFVWSFVIFIVLWVLYKEFLMNEKSRVGAHHLGSVSIDGFQGTAEDADIRGHNFDIEISDALSSEDYALAVRLRYLMNLKQLDSLSAIKWLEWKTPMMYIEEIEEGKAELRDITHTFLYIKYGHYPATKAVYEDVSAKSENLISARKGGMK